MAAKPTKSSQAKASAKPAAKKAAPKPAAKSAKPAPAKVAAVPHKAPANQSEWLQDASIEVPVPATANFLPGDRELEFSVGMRQQDVENMVRSELRARALVHAGGQVLVLVEASYVNVAPQTEIRADLPQYLYTKLRSSMEALFATTGHTPPLPASLEKVAE